MEPSRNERLGNGLLETAFPPKTNIYEYFSCSERRKIGAKSGARGQLCENE